MQIGDWIVVGNSEGTVNASPCARPRSETRRPGVSHSARIQAFDRLGRHQLDLSRRHGPRDHQNQRGLWQRDAADQELLLKCTSGPPGRFGLSGAAGRLLGFRRLGAEFRLRCFVSDTDKLVGTRSDLYFAIDDAFRANGIEIPLPQRVLHLKPGASGIASPEPASDVAIGAAIEAAGGVAPAPRASARPVTGVISREGYRRAGATIRGADWPQDAALSPEPGYHPPCCTQTHGRQAPPYRRGS